MKETKFSKDALLVETLGLSAEMMLNMDKKSSPYFLFIDGSLMSIWSFFQILDIQCCCTNAYPVS